MMSRAMKMASCDNLTVSCLCTVYWHAVLLNAASGANNTN